MKRKVIILTIAVCLLSIAGSILACKIDQHHKYIGVAVDRCFERDATLLIETPDGKQLFIMLTAKDAKLLRDSLNRNYSK